jgi:hypothetical protein
MTKSFESKFRHEGNCTGSCSDFCDCSRSTTLLRGSTEADTKEGTTVATNECHINGGWDLTEDNSSNVNFNFDI